jgi:outer membrane receptor protein involved in Fe transport
VLRGPQGTLYGANSLGGLIKFVTVDPSTDGFTGNVAAGASAVYGGAQAGYNVNGAVNVPITDDLAVRAHMAFSIDVEVERYIGRAYADKYALRLRALPAARRVAGLR